MPLNKELLLATLAIALAAGLLYYVDPSEKVKCVARSTIIARGQDWVDKNVPYNKGYDGYRSDCSGFVSMCWGLPRPGHTTSSLPGVTRGINKNDLNAGDALLCAGTHVTLFVSWADSARNTYVMMEQGNEQTNCHKQAIPYPYWNNKDCYKPVAYNEVC